MAIKLQELFYTLDMKTGAFVRGIKTAQGKGKGFTEFMRVAIPAGAAAAGAALVVLGGKAAAMAAEFEQGIAEVGTLVDTNVVNMKELREGVLDIFENVPVENVNDLTRGLYQMISAGIPAERAIADLAIAANAAVGGVTSVETAVDGLTTAMNAFASEGFTTAQAADSFFTAVRLGKTTFDEISGGVGRVAKLANSLGVTLDELLGSMVALTKGGLGTNQAFTGLQQILVNLSKPNEKLKKDFPELAAGFDLARLKADGLTKFMVDLSREIEGNDAAVISMFPSVEALNAAFALLEDGGREITNSTKEFANALGSADQAAAKMTVTTDATFQLMKNKFAVIMIDLGVKILPLVNAELKGMIGLLDLLSGKVAEVKAEQAGLRLENVAQALEQLTDAAIAERLEKLTTTLGELQEAADRGEDVAGKIEAVANAIERLGDVGDRRQDTFKQLTSDIRELLGDEFVLPGGQVGQTIRFQKALDALKDDQIQAMRRAFQAALASGKELARDFGDRFRQLNQEAVARGLEGLAIGLEAGTMGGDVAEPPGPEVVELTAEQIERLRELRDQAQELVDAASTDFVAKARAALELFKADVIAAGGDLEGEFAGAVKALEDAIAQAELAEKLDPQFTAIAEGLREATTIPELGELGQILNDVIIPALEKEVALAGDNTERRDDALDKLRKAGQLQTQLANKANVIRDKQLSDEEKANLKRLRGEKEITDEIQKQRQELLNMVGTIEAGVGGVIRLGEAFGLLSDKTSQALSDVLAIGTGIGRIAAGDLLGGGLAAVGGFGGLLGGLFGDSEADRVRQENTRAIQQLSVDFRKASAFLGATTGGQIAALQQAAADFLAVQQRILSGELLGEFEETERILNGLGLTIDDLVAAGKRLNITFQDETKPSFEELIAVARALQEVGLDRIFDSFAGQLELFRAEVDLFDDIFDDPIKKLEKLREIFSDPKFGSPALAKALGGLDLTTPEGRRLAEEAIQNLFRQLQSGTLTPEQLGGLTVDEFLRALLDFERAVDVAGAGADGGETTQFAFRATITEATGSRIASLLTTGVFLQQQTADNTARIVELLSGQPFEPVGPPAVTGRITTMITTDIDVHVHMNIDGGIDLDNAEQIGEVVGERAGETLDAVLGDRIRESARTQGDLSLN